MLNLYWKTGTKTINLSTKPFTTEADFEKYVFENQDLLPDIYIFKQQIRTGSKQGILDLLGVDQNNRICIIEMKNEDLDVDILPQILGYAIWADTNPDSIKAIWLEAEDQPEEIQIDWDNIEIRCIVIAPSFNTDIVRMASKMGYQIDFYQIQRFVHENEEFILVEEAIKSPDKKITSTKGKEDWSWEFYEEEHGKEAVKQFRMTVEAIDTYVKGLGLELPYNLNKYYTGFKFGTKVIFSVSWGGTHAWKIKMKLPENKVSKLNTENWEFQRYDKTFNEVIIRPKNVHKIDIDGLKPYLTMAYQYVSGKN
jgi:hypothetical protein